MVFVVVSASRPFQTTESVVYFYSKMHMFSPCDLRHVVICAIRCARLLFVSVCVCNFELQVPQLGIIHPLHPPPQKKKQTCVRRIFEVAVLFVFAFASM
jgi:hypothetical protein